MDERRESAPRITWRTADGPQPDAGKGVEPRSVSLFAALAALGASVLGATVITTTMLAGDPVTAAPIPLTVAEVTTQLPPAAIANVLAAPVVRADKPAPSSPTTSSAAIVPVKSVAPASPSKPDVLPSNHDRFASDVSVPKGTAAGLQLDDEDVRAYASARDAGGSPFDEVIAKAQDADEAEVALPEDETSTAAIRPEPEPEPEDDPDVSDKKAAGTALIVTDARIRSKPRSGAGILGTVPAGKQVKLIGCKDWCEIIHNGKRGFVYQKFVKRGGQVAAVSKPVRVQKARAKADSKPKVQAAAKGLPGVELPHTP